MRKFIPLMALVATPAAAEGPISAEDYMRRVAGGTFTIRAPGEEPYGIEAYLPDRRVSWGYFETGLCTDGKWEEVQPGVMCYTYEGDPEASCWHYYIEPDGFFAQSVDERGKVQNDILYLIEETDLTLPCVSDFLGS